MMKVKMSVSGVSFLDVVLDDEGFFGCCVGFDCPKNHDIEKQFSYTSHLNAFHALFCVLV